MGVTRNPPIDSSSPTSGLERVQVQDEKTLLVLEEIEKQLKIANLHNEVVTGDEITTMDID